MCASAGDRIVIGQASSPARCQVRLVEPSDAIEWIGAQPRDRQHVFIQVRGIDAAPAEHTLFLEHHRQRVALLARRAASDPEPAGGIGAQQRNDLFTQAPDGLGVAEHRRDVDSYRTEELLYYRAVVQHAVLKGGNGRHVFARHRRRQAAPDWGEGIFAEVVAVTEADALEEKADLDVLELSPRSL